VLLESGDLVGPIAAGMIRIGNSGSVFSFGLGEMIKKNLKSLLQGGAAHKQKPIT